MFPFFLFPFPIFLFLLITLFPSFLFQFVKILRSLIFWRVAEIVENKFLYKNIKNKGKKNTHKSGGRNIRTNLFSYYMSVHAHVIMWQENTGSQVTRAQAKQKKIKEIIKKLLTNRKQCYIIQSSTRDKRNKKTQVKNGGKNI